METEEKAVEVKKKSRALPVFIAGTAIGAAAGLLLAPESGKETRRKIGGWLKEKRVKLKERKDRKKQLAGA